MRPKDKRGPVNFLVMMTCHNFGAYSSHSKVHWPSVPASSAFLVIGPLEKPSPVELPPRCLADGSSKGSYRSTVFCEYHLSRCLPAAQSHLSC